MNSYLICCIVNSRDPGQQRVKKWGFSLEEALKDPAGRDQFLKFLESEFSSENLRLDVQLSTDHFTSHTLLKRDYASFEQPRSDCDSSMTQNGGSVHPPSISWIAISPAALKTNAHGQGRGSRVSREFFQQRTYALQNYRGSSGGAKK